MPHSLLGLTSYLVFLISCAVALWRGRTPERASAAVLAVMCVATPLIQDHVHYDDPRGLIYLTNVPQLVWLLAIALFIGRWWMLFAAAFEILCTTTEIGHDLVRSLVGPWVYLSVLIAWSWGVYLSLLVGAVTLRRDDHAGS